MTEWNVQEKLENFVVKGNSLAQQENDVTLDNEEP